MSRLACFCLLLGCAAAQTPVAPLRIDATCSPEDVRALALVCPADRPCPIYLELTALESAGRSVFLTGNLHAEDATLFSILLASDDGGLSWREPFQRIRGAGLDQIQFLDFATGWVAGESLGAIPRDPFLLVTQDGGKTWEKRPVFSESRTGVIAAFHFESEKRGRLWIGHPFNDGPDRPETYDSPDGGQTWARAQADNALPERGELPSGGDYRLETDAASHSYRVERRAKAGWEPVASFLVDAGECREPDVPATQP